MAVPTSVEFSVDALVDAHTALRDQIDGGTGAGTIAIFDSSDTKLAEVTLDDPCGTVSGVTGQLTITVATQDSSADATGVAAYAEIRDSDSNWHVRLPAQEGTVAVAGYIVLNSLNIIQTAPVSILSVTIG